MAKKKTKKNSTKPLLSLIAMVTSALTCLALFLNVWNWQAVGKNATETTKVGGYFENMEAYEKLFNVGKDKLPTFATTLAGISVIIALVCAFVFIVLTILKFINKSNKTISLISKASCLIMVLAGISALIGSLVFVLAEYEGLLATYSMSMAFGAIAGFIFPILGGTIGLISNK